VGSRSLPAVAPAEERSLLDELQALGVQEVELVPGLRHLEIATVEGFLTLLWHGARDAEDVVLLAGGAIGGTMGPGRALYHELGGALAEQGIGAIRIDYRKAGRLPTCVLDAAATADLAVRAGARRFVTVGHSFGGAVAVQVAAALPGFVRGVVGLATQSAGCEPAATLGDRPLLLVHGARDQVLDPVSSAQVRAIAGHGDVWILPDDGHGLGGSHAAIRDHLLAWIPAVLAGNPPPPVPA
jgi:pimeloyl-ACP methyl ester carboxylesterase